jgi:hypothetical protein
LIILENNIIEREEDIRSKKRRLPQKICAQFYCSGPLLAKRIKESRNSRPPKNPREAFSPPKPLKTPKFQKFEIEKCDKINEPCLIFRRWSKYHLQSKHPQKVRELIWDLW